MFTVYCSGHHSRVLLFTEHIEQLVNHRGGVELHWRCTCGTTGIHHIGRRQPTLVEAA